MKRTTAPNNLNNKFVDQDGATPGTRLIAEDMNLKQEEMCNLLEGFGITLDGGNDEQLKELFMDYLNQNVKSTDNVVFNDITGQGLASLQNGLTVDGHVECNDTVNIKGLMSLDNYFQMRSPTNYSTGSLVPSEMHLLPAGWYLANSNITATEGFFSYISGVVGISSAAGSFVAGGFIYSDGALFVINGDSSTQTFTYKKY